jgi:hypothetical protein
MAKKRRAQDSIDQLSKTEHGHDSETVDMEDYNGSGNTYVHRFISLEEGWNDIIKPQVSVRLLVVVLCSLLQCSLCHHHLLLLSYLIRHRRLTDCRPCWMKD